MSEDRPAEPAIPAADWMRTVHEAIGPASGASLAPDEQAALLDLARVAAHRSERLTAPLTTFLAGVAYGSLPANERAKALRSLLSTLEA